MRLARHFGPGGLAKFLAPADGGAALAHALFEAVGHDGLGAGFAAFAPGGAERLQLALAQGVLEAELDRVQPQSARYALHVSLHRPETLRHAVAAKGAR